MRRRSLLVALVYVLACRCAAEAQHCRPIEESYLGAVSLRHATGDGALEVKVEYAKTGGQTKEKYQAYLLAYLEKDADRVLAAPPAELLDKKVVCVLHTQAVERNDRGAYEFYRRLSMTELAKRVIEWNKLAEKDRNDFGGWGAYKDKVRLAVFVPYLEDKTYSVLPELPEEKHECPTGDGRFLLFQPLPYLLSIDFGYAKGKKLPEGAYYIRVNQTKPPELPRDAAKAAGR